MALAPDGRRVAAFIVDSASDIWILELGSERLTRPTFAARNAGWCVWTPDGVRVAFRVERERRRNAILWKRADGSSADEQLVEDAEVVVPKAFTPDGKALAFTKGPSATESDIWLLPLDGDRKPKPLVGGAAGEYDPAFSPDGRWLAYVSTESGRAEVYVEPFPTGGAKWQISAGGGIEPLWSPDGREIYYRSIPRVMAVSIATKPAFAHSAPRVLFEGPFVESSLGGYALAPDGKRFLMLLQRDTDFPAQINVVLDWAQELRSRLGSAQKK